MKNAANIQCRFGLRKLSVDFFRFYLQKSSFSLCRQAAHRENQEVYVIQRETSGDAKTRENKLR